MLEIPATITVLGQRYTILVQPDAHKALYDQDPDTFDALGHCDRTMLRITLRGPDGLAEDKVRETLLHETLHAIIGTSRVWPFDDHEGREEELVSTLAPLLLDTLRRNPGLVESLMSPHSPHPGEVSDVHAPD